MAVYGRFIKSAKRLIAKYGEACVWIENVAAVEDPDKPWLSIPAQEVRHNVRIAFFPKGGSGLETLAKALNSEITIGNVTGYMAAVSFKPSNKDSILRADGKVLAIEGMDEINVNGESVMFTIEATQ